MSIIKLIPGIALKSFLSHIAHVFPLLFLFPSLFFPPSVGIKLRVLNILDKCPTTEHHHQASYMTCSSLSEISVGLKGKSIEARDGLLKS